MNIEIKIKEIRESKRIRQIEVADALDMDNSQYAKIEKRGKKLSLEQIEKIAGALGVSVIELLGLDSSQVVEQVDNSDKDREIGELRKRVSELEKMNNLFEGNAYVIESISRKLINSFIEISYEGARYFHSEDTLITEESKRDNYRRSEEKYQHESKKVLKELVSQGSFLVVLKKILLEQKDKLKIILEWISTDKLITENPSLGYDYNETKKFVRAQIDSHSNDDIINEAMDKLFIPFFSGMGADE